ncbi:hypothetical protein [Streptosporangium sp. NPDC000396]|uniref:hypothetical protein n=1 Tax=Streptosporangium sp. NPDC000396 TaxID=3366185 RepID=UPI00367DC1D3
MAGASQQADPDDRATLWLSVTVVALGFSIGGAALCLGPNWLLFGMGTIIFALGGILLMAFHVLQDVTPDEDVIPDASHASHEQTRQDPPS